MNYVLKNRRALTGYCENPSLSIDNNHTERSLRGWAVGRGTLFGSDRGGSTAAALRGFVVSWKLVEVDPFAWFSDVLSRIAARPVTRVTLSGRGFAGSEVDGARACQPYRT